jgi:manganese/iron transport system substrate-binding protein
MPFNRYLRCGLVAGLLLLLAACTSVSQPNPSPTGSLRVVATTTIVGDVVHNIGGQMLSLTTLLPPGTDPHSYEPTPQDIALIADADLIFINGAGLETFMDRILTNSGTQAEVRSVSDGIILREAPQAESGEHQDEDAHEAEAGDPHTWTDPHNVVIWVDQILEALGQLDPANQAVYQANAETYRQELAMLDEWIRQQVSVIPAPNRQLVTDHELFGYFADRYGFTQIGTVIPGYSTAAQPSAQEIAALEDSIRSLGVRAIFVGNSVNPSLEERIAADTDTQLVFLYTGSLSDPSGPAGTYLEYIRYNVEAIVRVLK